MKDSQYLKHDLGARNDPKLMDLQMEMGGFGLGLFWCLVEMLWENEGFIPANYKSIAFALRWCKPAEVEKVVTGFGLFQVEDGMITSRSACARISETRRKIEAQREGGRKGSQNRWGDQQNGLPNGLPNSQPNGLPISTQMPNNKLNNKSINKDINNIPPTADFVFENFFFRNLKDHAVETERFFKCYQERHWTYQDGTPIDDIEKALLGWKPAKDGNRVKPEALNWYRAVWNAAKGRVDAPQDAFLYQLTNISLKGQDLALRYKTAEAAFKVADFVKEHDLAGDFRLDFRVSN